MSETKSLERHLIFDVAFLGIFILLIIVAGMYYFLHDDMITVNRTSFSLDENKQIQIQTSFNFTTTTLSAQNDIILEIYAIIPQEYLQQKKANPPEKLYLYITDAIPLNPTYNSGFLETSAIHLEPNYEFGYYHAKVKMKFGTEGEKCYDIFAEQVKVYSTRCSEGVEPLITVSSADSKFQYETTKITIALTLIFLAFAILSARDVLANMLGYCLRFDIAQEKNRMESAKNIEEDTKIQKTNISESENNKPTTKPDTININDKTTHTKK